MQAVIFRIQSEDGGRRAGQVRGFHMAGQLGRGLVCGVAPHRWRRCASPPRLDEFTHPAHNTATCAVESHSILTRCASMSTCDAYVYCSRPHDVPFSTRRQGRRTPTFCMYNDTRGHAWSALHVLSPQCARIRRVSTLIYICEDELIRFAATVSTQRIAPTHRCLPRHSYAQTGRSSFPDIPSTCHGFIVASCLLGRPVEAAFERRDRQGMGRTRSW